MSKMIIYQLLPRLFGNENPACVHNGSLQQNGVGKFAHINEAALKAIKRLQVTHIWFTGILEHATTTDYSGYGIESVDPALVKGKAGSPYAVRDYYDVSPDLAIEVPKRMDEFSALVERCHKSDLKVMIDFVPNHLFRQYASDAKPVGVNDFGAHDNPQLAFSPQNNFYYLAGTQLVLPVTGSAVEESSSIDYVEKPAKATGNDCFTNKPALTDWYETVKLNYGVDIQHGGAAFFDPIPDTWRKMLDILLFWADKGVDGFRCDMAEMVPPPFWAWAIPQVKAFKNIVFIAEIYKPERYLSYINSGFDYLYDKVGLYDTLKSVSRAERPASDISMCWQRLGELQPLMLHFLENHDEQRIASHFFLSDGYRAIPALVVSTCLNTAPFMLYAGQEFGERGMDSEGFSTLDGRTSIFDYWSVDTLRRFFNSGRCNVALLSESERQLYHLYIKLFSLLSSSPAIDSGATYDLTYDHLNRPHFDPHRHFAFLRHTHTPVEETLLIAVNFGESAADLRIHIPEHAFEHLHIPDHTLLPDTILFDAQTTVLFDPKTEERTEAPPCLCNTSDPPALSSATPFPLFLPPFGAKILRFKH